MSIEVEGFPERRDLGLQIRRVGVRHREWVPIRSLTASDGRARITIADAELWRRIWPHIDKAVLTVRITEHDGTPYSSWSPAFQVANDGQTCGVVLPTPTPTPTATPRPTATPTPTATPDPANCSYTGSGGHSKRDTDSEGDTDSDPNGDGDLHPNGAPNLDGDCYPYGDCYTDGDRNLDAGTNRNGSTDSLSHAEPYAVTDPDGNANGDGTRAIAHVSPDTGAPGPDGRRRAQCGALGVRNRGGDSVGRNGLYAHAAQARRAQGVGTSD